MKKELKLGERVITFDKLLKDQIKAVESKIWDVLHIESFQVEVWDNLKADGTVEENRSQSRILFGKAWSMNEDQKTKRNIFLETIPSLIDKTNFEDVYKRCVAFKTEFIPITDKRKGLEVLQAERAERIQKNEEERIQIEEKRKGQIEVTKDQLPIMLDVCFDNSDMMTDYFDMHHLHERKLVMIARPQSETQSLARSALNLLPDEIKNLHWEWKTEKWSMGHGNYLISKKVENLVTLKNKSMNFEAGETITGHYEITFGHSGWYTPIEGYYNLAEKTQVSTGAAKGEIRRNEALNGIEILFSSKPEEGIIFDLKANGFRWSFRNKVWYAKYSESKMQFAQKIVS